MYALAVRWRAGHDASVNIWLQNQTFEEVEVFFDKKDQTAGSGFGHGKLSHRWFLNVFIFRCHLFFLPSKILLRNIFSSTTFFSRRVIITAFVFSRPLAQNDRRWLYNPPQVIRNLLRRDAHTTHVNCQIIFRVKTHIFLVLFLTFLLRKRDFLFLTCLTEGIFFCFFESHTFGLMHKRGAFLRNKIALRAQ